jgi:hypothetical protein
VNKKVVRTEILSITRTEEVSLIDENAPGVKASMERLILGLWRIIKKYVISYLWIREEE